MNGEDVDAARRVEHAGEQAARDGALLLFRRAIDQDLYLSVEDGLVRHRPMAELAGQPIAHLGGRRLGEREAEDALRSRAGEQEPRHAIGQHLGLAGAGVGLDPRGMGGRRGPPLLAAGELQEIERLAHSSSPIAVDHSATRSRCS